MFDRLNLFNEFMKSPCERAVFDYYNFNNGDVNRKEFPMPSCLEDALKNSINSNIGYSNPNGKLSTRKRISLYESAKYDSNLANPVFSVNNVCTTVGVTNAIDTVFSVLGRHGEVIIPMPTYPVGESIALRYGYNVKKLPCQRDNDFLPSADDINEFLSDKTIAVFLTSVNNPTGTEYSIKQMEGIYETCIDKGVYLIIDEIFSDLMLNGNIHPLPDYSVEDSSIIRLNGLSKDRATSSLRIGYIVASEDIIQSCGNQICSSYGNSPTIYNALLEKDMLMRRYLLNPNNVSIEHRIDFIDYSRTIKNNIEKYELNNRIIHDVLSGTDCISDMTETHGGFCKYIQFKKDFVEKNGTDIALAKDIYKKTGVLLVPGYSFGSPPEDGWLRLTFSLNSDYLKSGLNALCSYGC